MQKIAVGLVGITGYAGMELARLLAQHPQMRLVMACSRAEAGRRLGEYYPFLENLPGADVRISVFEPEAAARICEIVFLAVPAGTAMKMTPPLLKGGVKVVDFSADCRLDDSQIYEEWYKQPHEAAELLPKAVYGLPEIYAKEIAQTSLVANPGCYPTSIILGLAGPLRNEFIEPDGIIADSKSGATGAGRKPQVPTIFSEVADNFRAYGLPRHRHTPEIEQELGKLAGKSMCISFTPHLVPMNRGILSTVYARLRDPSLTAEQITEACRETWRDHPWIRVLPAGKLPETRYVRGTMFCDLSYVVDKRTDRLVILSVIDNLCRGAAGQAMANANLMAGLPVSTGFTGTAPLF